MRRKFILVFVAAISFGMLLTGCGLNTPVSEVFSELSSATSDLVESSSSSATETSSRVTGSNNGEESHVIEASEEEDGIDTLELDEEDYEELIESDYDIGDDKPYDYLGSYNGTGFVAGSNDVSIFLNDGWDYVYTGYDRYSSISLTNDDYVYGDISVQTRSVNWDTCSEDEMVRTIEEEGFYGYTVYMAGEESKPDMTWNGLTWGATWDDIKAAYGENVYTMYNGDLFIDYTYRITDDVYIDFYVYKENELNTDTGLQQVSMYCY